WPTFRTGRPGTGPTPRLGRGRRARLAAPTVAAVLPPQRLPASARRNGLRLLGGARHRDGTAEYPVGRKRTGLYKGTRRPWPYLVFAHGASGEPRMQTRVENKPSTTKRMIVMIVAVLGLVAVIAGIKVLSIMRMIAASKPPPPAVVSTAKATSQDWQPELRAVGTLRAVRGADLAL